MNSGSGMQIGPYLVERELGRGGMGIVFLARDLRTDGARVVLKLLKAGLVATAGQKERLVREGHALARLRHPNIVQVIGIETLEDAPVLVLEYVAGETLEARLRAQGPWSSWSAAELVLSLTGAVEHAHAEGVLHRDLKPENVLLDAASGEPRLSDFGLARLADDRGERLTQTGQLMGSPGYWAPEQARGDKAAIGPATDVFGLGAILYALLSGEPPAQGATFLELVAAMERPPRPISAERPDVDRALEQICLRCLRRDPRGRYASATALAAALEDYLASAGSRVRAPQVVLGVGLLVLVAGVVVTTIGLLRGPAPTPSAPPSVRLPAPTIASMPTPAPSARRDPAAEAEALWRTATVRFEAGELREALADLDALARLDPAWRGLYTRRAKLRGNLGDRAGALADYDEALRRDDRNLLALVGRGGLHQGAGAERKAWADFERALQIDPRHPLARLGRGGMLLAQGDLGGALRDAEAGLAVSPTNVRLLYLRGGASYGLGKTKEALADFETIVQLDPGYVGGWVGRGNARIRLGRWRGAVKDYDRALRLDPANGEVLANRAWAKSQGRDYPGALTDFKESLRLLPNRLQTWLGRAMTYRSSGDHPNAARDFEQARRVDAATVDNFSRAQRFDVRAYVRKHLGRASRW